jgi:tRNA threonylcarbamoyladenosine biosynthesis protein TsaB
VPSNPETAAPGGARPRILALDTAGSVCSVAVAAADTLLSVESRPMLRGQAEALLPMVDAAMRAVALPVSALDMIAATVGPGSFTGIRVGLSAARGIAFAASLPLIGITVFEAVAAGVDCGAGADRSLLLVALDSRRIELYVQVFDGDMPLGPPDAVMPQALARWIAESCADRCLRVAGDAAQRAASALVGRARTTVAQAPAAVVGIARETLRRWRRGEPHRRAEPLYLRPPGVTLPRGAAGAAIA